MNRIGYILSAALTVIATSCFTGIESTPKISSNEVEKQKAETVTTPEMELALRLAQQPITQWTTGREYVVTDNRIKLIFSSTPAEFIPLKGDTIRYVGYKQQTSIAATENVVLQFLKKNNDNDTLHYRIERTLDELAQRQSVTVPFTVDLTLISDARKVLLDKELYILTSAWFDTDGQRIAGRKFVPVKVTDVKPASEEFPIGIVFCDSLRTAMLPVSAGLTENKRSFAAIFSFTDPKLKYPAITPENWYAIQNGLLRIDMTRDECRMSLGAPKDVDYGRSYSSTYERWTYTNGAYLIFEDGLLKRYRL